MTFINAKTGDLMINEVIVNSRMTYEFYLSQVKEITKNEMINGYAQVYHESVVLCGKTYSCRIYFDNKSKLESVSLYRCENCDVSKWNHSLEMQFQKENDLFLVEALGKPPYKYKWGQIESEYLDQSATNCITISYK